MSAPKIIIMNTTTVITPKGSKDEIQVKCKERVADHGEVFTAEREVNAMLDLVR